MIKKITHMFKSKITPKVMLPFKLFGIDKMLFKHNQKNLNLSIPDVNNFTISTQENFNPIQAKKLLENEGILIINDFFHEKTLESVDIEIIDYIKRLHTHIDTTKENYGNFNNVLWQYYGFQYNGHEIASMPIINIRNKDKNKNDGGMIDMFNIDKIFDKKKMPYTTKAIECVFNEEFNNLIREILPHSTKRNNLYFNDSVKNTRGAHRDDYHSTYKIFIYLTDVNDLEDGPYAFLPGSHLKDKFLKKEIFLNQIFGKNFGDISDIPQEFFLKCLGKKGTIIISNQSAIHMGLPQSNGNIRIAFVQSLF